MSFSAIENLRIACGVSGNVLSKAPDAQTVLGASRIKSPTEFAGPFASLPAKKRVALARLLRSTAMVCNSTISDVADNTAIKLSRQFLVIT